MSDSVTKSENVTASGGHRDAITASASPRPWRLDDGFECEIVDATGRHVLTATSRYAVPPLGDEREAANAALIVDAVNDRDHLRDLVRRFCDLFTPGTIHPDGTIERLLREARAAIGEDKQ